jgi:hypothetical protein
MIMQHQFENQADFSYLHPNRESATVTEPTGGRLQQEGRYTANNLQCFAYTVCTTTSDTKESPSPQH